MASEHGKSHLKYYENLLKNFEKFAIEGDSPVHKKFKYFFI